MGTNTAFGLIIKKGVLIILLFFAFTSSCTPQSQDIYNNFSGIVVWAYKWDISIEDFSSTTVSKMQNKIPIVFTIPFDKFYCYYWDEQVLVMKKDAIEIENAAIAREIDRESGGYAFFSFAVDGDIVLTGYNRLVFISNEIRRGDDQHSIPKLIRFNRNDDALVLRLSFFSWHYNRSIYEQARQLDDELNIKQDIDILFNDRVYEYFKKQNKIIRGRLILSATIYNPEYSLVPTN